MDKMMWAKVIFLGAMLVVFLKYIKSKNYTQEDYKKGLKILALIGVIVVVICLGGDTNQNPNNIWDRVFKPISGGNWMIHYGGIIPFIVIYWSLGRIYKLLEFRWLDRGWKRLVALVLILNFFGPIQEDVIKTYRSLQKGVDAIYLDREVMTLETRGEAKEKIYYFTLKGEVLIENPSKMPVAFEMFINIPPEYQRIVGTQWLQVYPKTGLQYKLSPKSRQKIRFEYTKQFEDAYLQNNSHHSRHSRFEVVLKNKGEIAYFEGDFWDKKMYAKDMKKAKERRGE